jgi:UDP-glucose 4-epimerase
LWIILVTGGSGFIGSSLVNALKGTNLVTSLDLVERQKESIDFNFVKGHAKDIVEIFADHSFDIVYHLGEYSRVEQSLSEFHKVLCQNTRSIPQVIKFCSDRNAKLVYSGSSTKFYNSGQGRFLSPYTLSKACNADLVKGAGQWANLNHAIVYFYNVYGKGERAGHYGTVIEKLLQHHANGSVASVTYPGTQTRNFTHINDTVRALIKVGAKGHGDDYKIGCRNSYSVLDAVQHLNLTYEMQEGNDANRLSSDLGFTRMEELGWSTEMDLLEYLSSRMSGNDPGR